MDKYDVIAALNDLIQICKDGVEGFRTCAKDISNPELKAYFNDRAERCAHAAHELQDLVIDYGGYPATSSHLRATLHRRWVDVRSAITGKSDEDVLDECERGEEIAKHHYEAALKKELPEEVRLVVEAQYRGVKHNYDQVRSMRDQEHARH